MKSKWPWWQDYSGQKDQQIRSLLRAILDLHGFYSSGAKRSKETWLWRGQANDTFDLSAGMHTRLSKSTHTPNDANVVAATEVLLDVTRQAHLDVHEGASLPDLALLARLQHHGAATPLLDVTLDPLVALYMAVVSPDSDDMLYDGVLFAIRKPKENPTPEPFDTRSFQEVYNTLPTKSFVVYTAPDVSDRLRIQRGHFVLSRFSHNTSGVSINATLDSDFNNPWIKHRLNNLDKPGPPITPSSDIAVFRVSQKLKRDLRSWLEETTGLSKEFVYPTVWHQPHQEAFAKSHNRSVPAVLAST